MQRHPEDLSAQGVPTTMGLQCVNWYGGRGGHLSFAPVLPQDGKLALVQVTSGTNPGVFYLFDVATKKASYLLSRREWIDPEQIILCVL